MNLHPSSLDGRNVFAWRTFCLVAVLLAMVSCEPRRDLAKNVQLLLTTQEFESYSSFEVRFPLDMVAANKVGRGTKLSPLRIEPSLPGEFQWLDARTGVFTPTEAPRMATKYRFRLSSGLQNAAGQYVKLDLDRTLETPPFRVTNLRTSFRILTNVSARPSVTLEFNAPVDIRQVEPHAVFRSGQREVPAIVKRFHGSKLGGYLTDTDLGRREAQVHKDWQRSFDSAMAARLPSVPAPISEPSMPPSFSSASNLRIAQTNVVTVTPAEPLTPADWTLELRSGLPSNLPALALQKPVTIQIGHVTPIRVLGAETRNSWYLGKQIFVKMNRWPEQDFGDKITITPKPKQLIHSASWTGVSFTGDFKLDQDYVVKVSPDLVSRTGESMKEGFETVVRFSPLKPQIRFPSFNVVQQSGGTGYFHVEAMNTPKIDFRAKRLSPETYLQILRSYERYARGGSRNVPFDLVPGQEIPNFWVRSQAERDAMDRLTIDIRENTDRQQGAVFVQASSRGLPGQRQGSAFAQAILQHTDIGLLWKNHATGSWVHAFSLLDGSPLKNVDLKLFSPQNEVVANTQTDQQGIGHLDSQKYSYLFANLGPDVNGLHLNHSALSRYGLGLPISWRSGGKPEPRMLFFVDKPVCRPGDVVRFKGIARRVGDEVEVDPEKHNRLIHFNVHDPRNRTIFSTNLYLSERGSFDFKFTTPPHKYGRYRASLGWFGESVETTFVAQDYEANAFEVKLEGPSRLLAEESIDLPVKARYFLGKNLSTAKVKWSLQAQDEAFSPKGFEDFQFGNGINDVRIISGQDSFSVHGSGTISPTNGFSIRTNVPIDIVTPAPRRVQAIAEVTDMNQQTVTAQKSLLIDSSEYYLGLTEPTETLHVGNTFNPQVIAIDRFGKPLTNASATLRLRRVDWHSVAIKGSGNSVRYRNEIKLVDIFRTNAPVQFVIREGRNWKVDPVSPAITLPTFGKPGRYVLESEGLDANGNRIYSAIQFYVAGANTADWEQRNGKRIDLIPDREEYRVGDHAEILVKCPIEGRALVSVERNTIHHSFTTNLTGNATVIRVPLTIKDAPNTFVSVTVLRGAADSPRQHKEPEYRYGFCHLKVIDDTTHLKISATPQRADYRPGEKVQIDVEVRDTKGIGVADAEVTLYAVDEGVLSLRGYETPNPLALFNGIRKYAVSTHLSLMQLQPADPAKIEYWNKGFLVGGGGKPLQRGPRTNFIACPLWEPMLVTDTNGRVSASFIAPDSLTRYRIIAVTHAGTDQFGHTENKVEIDKPLVVEPVLPRFARRGDELNVRALLINQTEQDNTVEVTWERVGESLTDGPARRTQRVPLKSGQTKTARFPLVFNDTGTARWKWSARFLRTNQSSFADSVISKLRVEEPLPLMRASLIGAISGKSNLLAQVDPLLLSGSGEVTVRLSNSPFIQLNGGMNYLLHYPYGCIEQTSSSLLPWILIKSDPILRRLYQKKPEDINKAIATGVNRLSSMQLNSGGFSYWPGNSEASIWGSAYAGIVLQLTQQHGADVTAIRLEQLERFLHGQLNRLGPREKPTVNHATALYTLALLGHQELTWLERLHARRKTLTAEACAFAALALVSGELNDKHTAMAADLLDESRSATRDEFHSFGSGSRLRAIELMAYRILHSPRESELTQKLLTSRRHGRWISTQENAWSLLALSGTKKPDGRKVTAQLNWGQESSEFTLATDPVQHERTFELSDARSQLPLNLSIPDGGTLYAEVEVSSHVERKFEPVTDKGFTVQRYFHKLAADNSPQPTVNLEIGDTIVVTLDLSVEEHSDYVAIDDPLPAVLQAINPEFKSQASGKSDWSTQNWYSDYRELRNDRALFFRNRLPAGKYRIQYLARVRADGQCTAPPTRVEEMYNPNRHGYGAPHELEATQ
ncbi:MAG: alpha-2-macroglobulin family protein [Limisphaerales bacterium]